MMARHTPWSRLAAACHDCGTDRRPHRARGYCRRCYAVRYLADELRGTLRHADNLSLIEEGRKEALADDLWQDYLRRGQRS